jgi:hypothetical protein
VVRRRKREKMASYKKNTCLQFLIKKKRDGEREREREKRVYLSIFTYLFMAAVLVVLGLQD